MPGAPPLQSSSGPSPGGGSIAGRGRGATGALHCPASLPHSPTGPPPCWGQAGLGRAGERGRREAGRGGRGQWKNPRRALAATAPPPQPQGQCPHFVQPLFVGALQTKAGKKKKTGIWSPGELSGVIKPWPGPPRHQERQWRTAEGFHGGIHKIKK